MWAESRPSAPANLYPLLRQALCSPLPGSSSVTRVLEGVRASCLPSHMAVAPKLEWYKATSVCGILRCPYGARDKPQEARLCSGARILEQSCVSFCKPLFSF